MAWQGTVGRGTAGHGKARDFEMRNKLRLLWVVIIILLLVLAAIVIGKPTPADASGPEGMYVETASWLRDGQAEAMYCQINANPEALRVTMYIYPWEGGKGYPLVIDLTYDRSVDNCHFWKAEWHPGNYGIYNADTYYSKGGGILIYDYKSAKFVRIWFPMTYKFGAEGDN